ncbi:MAG: DMT family transporter [Xanthobacteraceae bacterium]|nr:MAG: DMT family transporter [Xanthobacteraceae bacterium]
MNRNVETLAANAAPFLFVFLWSTGFLGAKFGLPYAEPMTFLTIRMLLIVPLLIVIALVSGVALISPREIGHSAVVGALVHGLYLGGVFVSIGLGIPAGLSALITGMQPILTATIANRWLGERVSGVQWIGLALGLVGVALVLHNRPMTGQAGWGWLASFVALFAITIGALYQKRFGGRIDWRIGNIFQYSSAGVMFAIGAMLFETRAVQWTPPFIFALGWLTLALSLGAITLLYWLIRHSAATKVASFFYLVPATTAVLAFLLFDEKLDLLSIAGMVGCATGVVLVNLKRDA